MAKQMISRCLRDKSKITGRGLRECYEICKNKICSIYEHDEQGKVYIYQEDRRTWFDKHLFEIIMAILVLIIGSIILPGLL